MGGLQRIRIAGDSVDRPHGAVNEWPIGEFACATHVDNARIILGVLCQVNDGLLSPTHANVVEGGFGGHVFQRDQGMHPADHDPGLPIDLFENTRHLFGRVKMVAAHVHEQEVIALNNIGHLCPGGQVPQ